MKKHEYKYFKIEFSKEDGATDDQEDRLVFIQKHLDKLSDKGWEVLKIDERPSGLFLELFSIELWCKRIKQE